jgi:hypothetical protein
MSHSTQIFAHQLRWRDARGHRPRQRSAVRPWVELLRQWRERNAASDTPRPRWPRVRGLRGRWLLALLALGLITTVGIVGSVHAVSAWVGAGVHARR